MLLNRCWRWDDHAHGPSSTAATRVAATTAALAAL